MTRPVYPLADRHPGNRRPLMGWHPPQRVMAVFSGELRPPKKGEWYLSGAIVEAYQAPNDLQDAYYIAKLVRVETRTVVDIVGDVE